MRTNVEQVLLFGISIGVIGCNNNSKLKNKKEYKEKDKKENPSSPEDKENFEKMDKNNYTLKKINEELDSRNDHKDKDHSELNTESHALNVLAEIVDYHKQVWNQKLSANANLNKNIDSICKKSTDNNFVNYIKNGHLGSLSIEYLSKAVIEQKDLEAAIKKVMAFERDCKQMYLLLIPGFTISKTTECQFIVPFVDTLKEKTQNKQVNIHECNIWTWFCGHKDCKKDNNTLDNKASIMYLGVKYFLKSSLTDPKEHFVVSINESFAGIVATKFWADHFADCENDSNEELKIDFKKLYIAYVHTPHNGTEFLNFLIENKILYQALKQIPIFERMADCDNVFKCLTYDGETAKQQKKNIETLQSKGVNFFNAYGGDGNDILVLDKSAILNGMDYFGKNGHEKRIENMGHLPKGMDLTKPIKEAANSTERLELQLVKSFIDSNYNTLNKMFGQKVGIAIRDRGYNHDNICKSLEESKIYDEIVGQLPNKAN